MEMLSSNVSDRYNIQYKTDHFSIRYLRWHEKSTFVICVYLNFFERSALGTRFYATLRKKITAA
jgi:hypothetical protein